MGEWVGGWVGEWVSEWPSDFFLHMGMKKIGAISSEVSFSSTKL